VLGVVTAVLWLVAFVIAMSGIERSAVTDAD
jgi:hypothetical protein